jgi:hypothetical protein
VWKKLELFLGHQDFDSQAVSDCLLVGTDHWELELALVPAIRLAESMSHYPHLFPERVSVPEDLLQQSLELAGWRLV